MKPVYERTYCLFHMQTYGLQMLKASNAYTMCIFFSILLVWNKAGPCMQLCTAQTAQVRFESQIFSRAKLPCVFWHPPEIYRQKSTLHSLWTLTPNQIHFRKPVEMKIAHKKAIWFSNHKKMQSKSNEGLIESRPKTRWAALRIPSTMLAFTVIMDTLTSHEGKRAGHKGEELNLKEQKRVGKTALKEMVSMHTCIIFNNGPITKSCFLGIFQTPSI